MWEKSCCQMQAEITFARFIIIIIIIIIMLSLSLSCYINIVSFNFR